MSDTGRGLSGPGLIQVYQGVGVLGSPIRAILIHDPAFKTTFSRRQKVG